MTPLDALAPTWPPKHSWRSGPFKLRDGAGGGKRVSAATLEAGALPDASALPDAKALAQAEAEMRALGQAPLFSLTPDQTAFNALLEARGYRVVDPTRLYHAPIAEVTRVRPPPVTTFEIWEPLAIMEDIWAAGGIGPARRDIMRRVSGPRTGLLGRIDAKPAGAAFVAAHESIAMLHALEIAEAHRRKGLARWMVIAAAHWAARQDCETLALLVTEANAPANALYQGMGFHAAPGYHYRMLEE
jgi:GNAT superfamily N-acetyltransferase